MTGIRTDSPFQVGKTVTVADDDGAWVPAEYLD
jgi:hypothetical protein